MSQALGSDKSRIEHAYWLLLRQRYPASALWWEQVPGDFWWPEWSETAFLREIHEWLLLAEAANRIEDPEVISWGRYARFSVGRLRGEVWRRPAAPLSHVRYGLSVLTLLGDYPRLKRALQEMPRWLDAIKDIGGGDYWAKTELTQEVAGVLGLVSRIPFPSGIDHVRWTVTVDQVKASINRYAQRCAADAPGTLATVPWIGSAHIDAGGWHRQRQQHQGAGQPLLPLNESNLTVVAHKLGVFAHDQFLVRQSLKNQGFVRWNDLGSAAIYYGRGAYPALLSSLTINWWHHKAQPVSALTWVLAEPTLFESQLLWLCTSLANTNVLGHAVTAFLKWRVAANLALAYADAWLWIEGGDPDEVVAWLKLFLSPATAAAWIPVLKANPGRALMVADAYRVMANDCLPDLKTTNWTGWQWGPIAPDILAKISSKSQ